MVMTARELRERDEHLRERALQMAIDHLRPGGGCSVSDAVRCTEAFRQFLAEGAPRPPANRRRA